MKNITFLFICCFLSACIDAGQVAEVPDSPTMGSEASQQENAQVGPIYEIVPRLAWNGKTLASDAWTIHTISEFKKNPDILNSVPIDVAQFCPNYEKLSIDDRALFYAHLLSKMAEYESGFKPDRSYKECSFKESTYGSSGKWIELEGMWCIPGHKLDGGVAISRGLMQMSLESAIGYGCQVSSPSELHDAFKSISCAVKVFNRLVPKPRIVDGKTRGHGYIASKVDGSWKGASAYWAVVRDSSGYNKESSGKIKLYTSQLEYCRKQ